MPRRAAVRRHATRGVRARLPLQPRLPSGLLLRVFPGCVLTRQLVSAFCESRGWLGRRRARSGRACCCRHGSRNDGDGAGCSCCRRTVHTTLASRPAFLPAFLPLRAAEGSFGQLAAAIDALSLLCRHCDSAAGGRRRATLLLCGLPAPRAAAGPHAAAIMHHAAILQELILKRQS